MKKRIWIPLLCFAVIGAGLWLMLGVMRPFALRSWEVTLDGPFTGVVYTNSVTAAPSSVLSVPPHGQLEVHELLGNTNPVVLLRAPSGKVEWSRLFLPEKRWSDGTEGTAWLRELRLKKLERRSTNVVVWITCDWEWGGIEGGLIYLDHDFGFKHFGVSW